MHTPGSSDKENLKAILGNFYELNKWTEGNIYSSTLWALVVVVLNQRDNQKIGQHILKGSFWALNWTGWLFVLAKLWQILHPFQEWMWLYRRPLIKHMIICKFYCGTELDIFFIGKFFSLNKNKVQPTIVTIVISGNERELHQPW